MRTWTEEEIIFLKDNYPIEGAPFCADKLNRTIESIRLKAGRLNLKRNALTRYKRPDTPDGYTYCFSCKQTLEDSKFYRKTKLGKYGKKSNLCRNCSQVKARRHYSRNRSSNLARLHSRPEKTIYNRVKSRANKHGIEFTILVADIVIPAKCPILGIDIVPFSGGDNSPSVDRINSNKGYTKDNIAIISNRANRIKNNSTKEELLLIYNWLLSKEAEHDQPTVI